MNVNFNSLSPGMKSFLEKREIRDKESLDRFLDPTFKRLRPPDETLKKVVRKIRTEILEGKNILIWGDEDMDGISSTLIMLSTMEKLTARKVENYIPSRRFEGYGLCKRGIDLAVGKGIDLIITVDCGVNDSSEVEYLKREGLDVIITDHHEPKENLPNALILNPKLGSFGFKYLAGAGVAFKLADALFNHIMGESTTEWTRKMPEIPALTLIGTIADRVPQLDENRILIHEGLRCLEETSSPPLSLLHKLGDIEESMEPLFSGVDNLTWEFFTTSTIKKAREIYEKLKINHANWSIRAKKEFSSLKAWLDEGHFVLFVPDLDQKFAGFVTGRAKEYTNHPIFVIYQVGDNIRGEGRGPKDFNLLSVLSSVKDLLVDYGGHKPACGFTLKKGKVEEFKERVEPRLKEYKPKTSFDARIELWENTK
ncbi:MAG: DHH family phosphoesterase [candidate division WOR-3 bacterium]|nr:DHH family phosphoesterase [candidate division WOR-3 bacterium]